MREARMSVQRDDGSGHPPEVEDSLNADISWKRWGWVVVVATTTWIVWQALDGGARWAWAREAMFG
jgi:hypothetical protein